MATPSPIGIKGMRYAALYNGVMSAMITHLFRIADDTFLGRLGILDDTVVVVFGLPELRVW